MKKHREQHRADQHDRAAAGAEQNARAKFPARLAEFLFKFVFLFGHVQIFSSQMTVTSAEAAPGAISSVTSLDL